MNPAAPPEDPDEADRHHRDFLRRLEALAPRPWAAWLIAALNVGVWLVMLSQGAGFLNISVDMLFAWGGNTASEVQGGESWRLLTAMFLHGGLLHIAMNMIGLLSTGYLVERIYGRRLFLLIYLGAGLMGGALSLHFSAQAAVSVGASGAVFGLTGAILVAVWQHRERLPATFSKEMLSGVGFFIVYSLAQGLVQDGIDNAAHIGGLLGGVMLALILPERFDPAHYRRVYARRAGLGLLSAALAVAGLVAASPPAAEPLGRIFASQPLLDRGLNRFDRAMQTLQQEHLSLQEGRISEQEADERSRTVHAPAFRQAAADLGQVVLRRGDPREPLRQDVLLLSRLLEETLAMESVLVEGRPRSVDPARSARIQQEIQAVSERLKQRMAGLRAGK